MVTKVGCGDTVATTRRSYVAILNLWLASVCFAFRWGSHGEERCELLLLHRIEKQLATFLLASVPRSTIFV
jgi:hypothetical protein